MKKFYFVIVFSLLAFIGYGQCGQTDAPVFVSTSNNPIIGSWVDGDIELTDGNNTYNYSVTEFDNIVANVAFGTYNYTFTRPGACDTTGTVVVDCSTIEAQSGNVFLPIFSEDQTSANVFVSTSNNPIIGSWVDGDIELTDGNNTYNYSVTEFDNIVANVAFGTYNYTFTRPGACDTTGTVVIDCSTIEAQSGNVFLPIFSEDQTSANVFVSTSSNPIIGAWVDGDIELTDGNNTYNYSVTEFDNIVANVAFGTYNYTFTRPGACDVTGTVDVNCSTIEAQSGNVFLPIFSEDQTSANVFVSTSSNPIIGAWVDGDIELTDGNNTYNYSVTEFDNIVANVA
ncbi:hypothetical protein, partial [Hanstruepera flava]|uniref:hypothetical protein n=1 Tax=Hanstruepera flava TaxID=2930218 RepID=UPI002028ACC2